MGTIFTLLIKNKIIASIKLNYFLKIKYKIFYLLQEI